MWVSVLLSLWIETLYLFLMTQRCRFHSFSVDCITLHDDMQRCQCQFLSSVVDWNRVNPVSLHSDTVVPVKVLLFTMDWNCVISRTHHDDPELSSFTSSLSLIHGWKSQLVFILKFAFLISHWCRGESLGWYFMLKSAFLICHWYMGENLSWYLHWNLHFRFVINTWVKKSQLVLIFRSGFLICHWYTGEKVSVGIYTKICMSEAWNIEKFCLSSLIIKPWCKTKNSRHDPKFFHALQDSVTAIPYNEWTSEFIRPRIICIRINGV